MDKVFESLERLAMPDELYIEECEKCGVGLTEDYELIKQVLTEFKSIKEANPSKAMECLIGLEEDIAQRDGYITNFLKIKLDIIKQALQRLESIDNAIKICKKANEQKCVYIKVSYGIVKEKFLDDLDYEVLNNRLYVNSRGIYYSYPLNDYGNWWALTKEELENE